MKGEMKKRLNSIKFLREKLDGILLLSGDTNYFYFTNSTSGKFFYYDFSRPKIFSTRADEQSNSWVSERLIIEKLDEIGMRGRIGINWKNITLAQMKVLRRKKARFVDVSKHLEETRMIKTQYEIALIKKSCRTAKKIIEWAMDIYRGRTEHQLANMIEVEMRRQNVLPAFPTIVSSGKSLRNVHHAPGKIKIKKPFLIDLGVKYKGYCSDITRTTGSVHEDSVNRVMEKAAGMIEDGTPCIRVYEEARKKLGKKFVTSLGHGIGMEVHERPSITKKTSDIFRNGMTFTIEPGLYMKNGIRIENDYLLKSNRVVCLTC
jgi:Xaa-Pro dipeptidase